MALYEHWADAPKDITNASYDSTPFWISGVKWLDVTDVATTTAKAMTAAACLEQKGAVITAAGSETSMTNTTCGYAIDSTVIKSYTFTQTVTVTVRALANP